MRSIIIDFKNFANILRVEIKALKAEVALLESKVNSLEIWKQAQSKIDTDSKNEDQLENDCVDHNPIQPFKPDVDSTPTKSRKRKLRNSHDDGNATIITPGINIDDVLKAELDNDSMTVVDVNHDILNQSGSDNGMSEFDLSNFYDPEESSNFKLIMDSLDSTVRFREVNSITTTKQNSLVICTGCDKQMGYYSWKQHVIAIHAKLKPYVCHDCGYNTSVSHIIRSISYGP